MVEARDNLVARVELGQDVAGRAFDWVAAREPAVTALLEELVNADSHADDLGALWAHGTTLHSLFGALGSTTFHERDGRRHLSVDVGEVVSGRFPVVLCHYDTVWPTGTAAAWPFESSDGVARGPGVLDMKGSIVMAYFALEAMRALGVSAPGGVRLLLTADEEDGNPTSRGFIAEAAASACAALVLEPPLPRGRLKTRRKGVLHLNVRLEGRAAHAGADADAGRSAVLSAARFALAAASLADPKRGVSVNVGVLRGGERRNVVADLAQLELDVRAFEDAELDAIVEALTGWAAGDGITLMVEERLRRPPMRRTEAIGRLLALAREVALPLRLELEEGDSGGGSEGNLVAQLGLPVLDGLGAEGGGAHSRSEHVILSSLIQRTALLAGLLTALTGLSTPGIGPSSAVVGGAAT